MDLDAGFQRLRGNAVCLRRPAIQAGVRATDSASHFRLRRDIDRLGLPKGLTLHGLRKSLGVYLAEAEASTRQLMDVLGHDDIDHAELYSREASQVRLAVQGMDRVVRLVTRKPLLGEPVGPEFSRGRSKAGPFTRGVLETLKNSIRAPAPGLCMKWRPQECSTRTRLQQNRRHFELSPTAICAN
jgi:hypothetical protein